MAYDVPTTEPTVITAGDTITWSKSLADYQAPAYVLYYQLIGSATSYAITAAASGADHLVTVAKATSAAYVAGDYKWSSFVKDSGNLVRYSIGSGTLVIKADPATSTDSRSHVKKVLDAIEAVILGTASKEEEEYTVASGGSSRSLKRRSMEELYLLRARYLSLYQQEKNAETTASGGGNSRTIKVRFKDAS